MGRTKLVIRKEQANLIGLCAIYVKYTHQSRSTYFSTGEMVLTKYWDAQKCEVRKSFRGYTRLNEFIQKFKGKVDDIKLQLRLQEIEPTAHLVKEEYLKSKGSKINTRKTLFELTTEYLEHKVQVEGISKNTQKQFRTFVRHLKDFEQFWGKKITFARINQDFYDSYIVYFYELARLAPNSVGTQIKELKAFLNWAKKKGYNSNQAYRDFKKPTAKTAIIYLTRDELNQLFNYPFENKKLERVRDMFVLACVTGLRFSDLSRLTPKNVVGNYIKIKTQKTGDPLRIPLNDYSRFILSKYENLLPTMSNQKMNQYLKEAAKVAGLNSPREVYELDGRNSKSVSKELHEIISSHMGRKTFVSLCREAGVSPEMIMTVTGHKNYKTLQAYLGTDEKVRDEKMMETWRIE